MAKRCLVTAVGAQFSNHGNQLRQGIPFPGLKMSFFLKDFVMKIESFRASFELRKSNFENRCDKLSTGPLCQRLAHPLNSALIASVAVAENCLVTAVDMQFSNHGKQLRQGIPFPGLKKVLFSMNSLIKSNPPCCRKFANPRPRVPTNAENSNVSARLLIELQKMRMSQPFCSSMYRKLECLSSFAHRVSKNANVSALLFIDLQKTRMSQPVCSSSCNATPMSQPVCSSSSRT